MKQYSSIRQGKLFKDYFSRLSMVNEENTMKYIVPIHVSNVFKNTLSPVQPHYNKLHIKDHQTDLFGYEVMLSGRTTALHVDLYITVGGDEDPYTYLQPFQRLVDSLQSRNNTGFSMKSYVDLGKGHYIVWEPTLYEGVRMFFKNS